MAYLFLAAAILSEVVGTLATRFSDGFTKLVPSVVAAIGVLGAYILLSQSLKLGMGVGVAYAIWAGAGVVLVAGIGALVLGDKLVWAQGLGIALIICGVLTVELGASSDQTL